MLKKSNSASISAIVASIVCAFPEKFFSVAKILFGVKDFFHHDNYRWGSEHTGKSLHSIGYGLDYKRKVHQDERIKSYDDKHRAETLESLIRKYQFF